ncbi:MAG: response regulator [Deltaproteobacteria bacterium]|jgi:CheY-like chemotaxis protein|nr:response regulator [Deltaproteobacteria bacterium]
MLKKKVLIVDDEEVLCELIMESLSMKGDYSVERAFNGQEALDKYKAFLPDIVVMDVEMPVMDGYESSSKIKSFDPEARILVLTGNPGDSRARRTIEEGIALTLLQKPVRLVELNRTISEHLPAYA